MEVKKVTNENYIPLTDLSSLGEHVISDVKQYRKQFNQIVMIDDHTFAFLVETPELIKARFIKNIELKDKVEIQTPDGDVVLKIARDLANGKTLPNIKIDNIEVAVKKYRLNNNDLTVLTTHIVKNIRIDSEELRLTKVLPELNKFEEQFVSNCNNDEHSYTANDFIDITSSSYETARKGLEKLTALFLYKKNKVGKRFVYRPTKKLEVLIKGGA